MTLHNLSKIFLCIKILTKINNCEKFVVKLNANLKIKLLKMSANTLMQILTIYYVRINKMSLTHNFLFHSLGLLPKNR